METTDQNQDHELQAAELESLKARADQLGIKYHPNIGIDKLREKVAAALEEKPSEKAPAAATPAAVETLNQRRLRQRQEANALVRCRITCMNPNKKEWQGEIFTVSNAVVGTIRKYVPFDTEWHAPRFILNMIKQRQCQIFYNATDDRGNKVRRGKQIREFAVEELAPLTEKELKELAQRQALANGTAEAVA